MALTTGNLLTYYDLFKDAVDSSVCKISIVVLIIKEWIGSCCGIIWGRSTVL